MPEEVIREMPDVNLVFWNYFRTDEEYYKVNLQKHRAFGKEVSFAGGVQTWNGFTQTSACDGDFKPALKQCIENNVRTVIATVWCDDGCETNHFWRFPVCPCSPNTAIWARRHRRAYILPYTR